MEKKKFIIELAFRNTTYRKYEILADSKLEAFNILVAERSDNNGRPDTASLISETTCVPYEEFVGVEEKDND